MSEQGSTGRRLVAGLNLTQKIIQSHLTAGELKVGTEVSLRIDQGLLQDTTGTMGFLQLEELGVDRIKIPFAIVYVDHNILAIDFRNPDDHMFLRSFAQKHGIHFSRPGTGICHYLHMERFAKPGQILLGADSHTVMAGSVSMIAIGAGGLDVAVALAGHGFTMAMPKVVEVRLENKLGPWIQAKDIILELLRRRDVKGGVGRIFEFTGPGVETLSVPERGTICNMIAELGATTGIFPSDRRTKEWLIEQQRPGDFVELAADPGATYEEREVIDLATLEPLIAKPSSPGNVVPVREVAGTKVQQVCVGSSVNSGYSDLAIVAAVMKGKTVHPEVFMTVTPGSKQILDALADGGAYQAMLASGARMLEPACGPCVGMGQAPPTGSVSVRTFNRNFPGRSGTDNDQVYLCSPTTAAATALRGVITDPRDLGEEPTFTIPAMDPGIDDSNILVPPPTDEAAKIHVIKGPNIQPPPRQTALQNMLHGEVIIKLGDNVSTGDLSPDGAVVMALRSNVNAIAEFTFKRFDPKFPQRAREKGGGFIVAGQNYGQGSSREHAALAPKALGIHAVIAQSFARIHRRNLISQGIPPLVFKNESDLAKIEQGDVLTIDGLRDALGSNTENEIVTARTNNGVEIPLSASYLPSEARTLLAGGLLAELRRGGEGLSAGVVVSGAADQGSPQESQNRSIAGDDAVKTAKEAAKTPR
ncbi:MAG TPA: aconitate hydratase [Chloroflexi bacterium]|jgi:aconitate hydratase|nr:aconitate hydratase [Chloroflexota bacterium]HAL26703.1 aconitate hydratase [Chloroflexota bacterium]